MGYIYIGKYFHKAGKELPNLTEKKIGKTIDLDNREKEIGRTNSPIGYTYIKAWDTGSDMDKIERQIHVLLDHDRMIRTECFDDRNNDLVDRVSEFMEYGGYKEVELRDEEDILVRKVRKEAGMGDIRRYALEQTNLLQNKEWTYKPSLDVREDNMEQTIEFTDGLITIDTNGIKHEEKSPSEAGRSNLLLQALKNGYVKYRDEPSDRNKIDGNVWAKTKDKDGKMLDNECVRIYNEKEKHNETKNEK